MRDKKVQIIVNSLERPHGSLIAPRGSMYIVHNTQQLDCQANQPFSSFP